MAKIMDDPKVKAALDKFKLAGIKAGTKSAVAVVDASIETVQAGTLIGTKEKLVLLRSIKRDIKAAAKAL